jgi:ApbE superfamily uncharacterized protein (UPF0280 family)
MAEGSQRAKGMCAPQQVKRPARLAPQCPQPTRNQLSPVSRLKRESWEKVPLVPMGGVAGEDAADAAVDEASKVYRSTLRGKALHQSRQSLSQGLAKRFSPISNARLLRHRVFKARRMCAMTVIADGATVNVGMVSASTVPAGNNAPPRHLAGLPRR